MGEVDILINDLTDDPRATPGDEERRRDTYQLRRVPGRVRAINRDAYTPRFVCIGPYHRGKPKNPLRRERLKARYVRELLRDVVDRDHAKQRDLIKRCAESLKTLEDDVRWFYAEEDIGSETRRMESGELVRMLLLDGCFIIKHLYYYARGVNEAELYQTRWAPAQLRIDLGLLENQLPYFVLEALFDHLAPLKLLLGPHRSDSSLDTTTRKRLLLRDMTVWYMMRTDPWPQREPRIHHLLHLMHVWHLTVLKQALELRKRPAPLAVWLRSKLDGALCGCPVRFMRLLLCRCHGPGPVDAKDNIASAVELRNMGIKIYKAEPATSGGMLDVRLRDDGVTLEIPPLTIEQATAPLLHNLIAFEQQATPGARKRKVQRLLPVTDEHHQQELVVELEVDDEQKTEDYFTTYAFLMYNLVNTRGDIALLQELGILQNNFGSDDQIINYFKNLCMWNQRSETNINQRSKTNINQRSENNIPLEEVLRKLRQCSHNRAYSDWAEVKKYINSPVKILLVILSAVVSASSVLQAIFAFRSRS